MHTAIYGAHIRFRPTLNTCDPAKEAKYQSQPGTNAQYNTCLMLFSAYYICFEYKGLGDSHTLAMMEVAAMRQISNF
jgi:hypothetical protein